ncbi:MAG: wax ester/triacylglycerol synthase family O-acyltransferase [Myxococcota bacterium]|nr:wax ester/triacylglycerol synthase family O-acyltransferase [Myxococcota bacterium]
MQQLSGLDNSFLVMEAGGNLGHVASLSTFDTTGLGGRSFYESVRRTIEERLHLLPPYRRRLVEVPFDLDRPYWIEDPDFDLDFHIRHIAVPPPGDELQLSELIARIHSRPLDRARPLWESYVIEGLAEGQAALYMKIHHCTIDGVSGAEMGQVLLDQSPDGAVIDPPEKPWQADRLPSGGEMLLRGAGGLAVQPGRAVRIAARTARGLWESDEARGAAMRMVGIEKLPIVGRILRGGGDQVDADEIPQTPAPRTPFNRAITPHRRFAYFSLSLDSFKQVKRAFGTTLNDVVMAVCGTALRRYLLELGELPKDPLVAMVPVSVRNDAEKRAYGNRVTSILSELATDIEDGPARLQRIHQAMASAKRIQRATPATLLTDWTEVATPALLAQAARISARTRIMDRMRPPFNVVISNVPGPRESLYCGGAEMLTYYPVSAVADGMGLNITVTSYKDHLDFGLISCRELVPDIWRFPDLFAEGLEDLVKAAELATAPKD